MSCVPRTVYPGRLLHRRRCSALAWGVLHRNDARLLPLCAAKARPDALLHREYGHGYCVELFILPVKLPAEVS